MTETIWEPGPGTAANTNVGRFMARHGIATFEELRQRSIDDVAWFWDAVVQFLGLPFSTPYTSVLDESDGIEWARWFSDGETNLTAICLDRWAADTPDAEAVRWEGEDGEVRVLTYAELARHVDGLAALLRQRGIGRGDSVGIFLPMLVETVVAALAVAKVGAIFLPVFSGYGADAISVRLEDAEARALLTADGFLRRGKPVPMLETARAAVASVPSVSTVVVVPRLGTPLSSTGRVEELAWPEPTPEGAPEQVATVALAAETPLFIAYTSGTTGKPKGSVHVHGGFTVKIAEEVAFQFDCGPGDRLFWFADFGWIMGPWEVVGTLANGATLCLYEGAPDFPDVDRLWDYLAAHRVTILGISPTLVRSMMGHGDQPVLDHDLSALRILGSTGEPWNEEPYRWFHRVVGAGRVITRPPGRSPARRPRPPRGGC